MEREVMNRIPEDVKKEIMEKFTDCNTVHFATVDGERPSVRPLTMVRLEGRFWILTGTSDAKMVHLNSNPAMELCYLLKEGEFQGYIRAAGTARIIQDEATRERIAEQTEYFKVYWKGYDDPNYTLLEIVMSEIEYMKPGASEIYARKYIL